MRVVVVWSQSHTTRRQRQVLVTAGVGLVSRISRRLERVNVSESSIANMYVPRKLIPADAAVRLGAEGENGEDSHAE